MNVRTDRKTDKPHELHIYVGLAQARPNNMGNRDLPDIYSYPHPQACGRRVQVYRYIRQISLAHFIIKYDST